MKEEKPNNKVLIHASIVSVGVLSFVAALLLAAWMFGAFIDNDEVVSHDGYIHIIDCLLYTSPSPRD